MTAWTPALALETGFRFVDARLLRRDRRLFLQMAKSFRRTGPRLDAGALLVNLFEHLFTAEVHHLRQEFLARRAGARVLDYGCGAGFHALNLALQGRQVICADANPVCLQFIRYAARRLGVRERIAFRAEPGCDSVICIHVLDHVPDAPALIETFYSLLPPGGDLFLEAHFSQDGVHVSDQAAIDRTFASLVRRFRRAPAARQPGPWLEWWIRRPRPVDGTGKLLPVSRERLAAASLKRFRPLRHPEAQVAPLPGGGAELRGPRFYLRRIELAPDALAVFSACDGRRSIAEIAHRLKPTGISQEACLQTVWGLWKRRYLEMRRQA